MKTAKICSILMIFLCIVFWQGKAFAQTPTPTPEINAPNQTDAEFNLIHLGDLIDVDVVGSFEFDWRGTLTNEGYLNGLDTLENQVFGLCRKEDDVAKEIAKAYSKTGLRDPQVVVKILDRSNRPNSTLFGAIKTPQRFRIKRPVLLNELIILAGGFTEKASGEIEVFRPVSLSCAEINSQKNLSAEKDSTKRERYISTSQDNGSQTINIRISDLLSGKKEANVQILSGDIVTVLEAQPIYVIGGVTNPRQIATRSKMTVSRAISGAGGLSKNADAKKITIFRRAGSDTKIIETDLDKIKANQAEDIVLQAFDIVEVSQKGSEKRKYPPIVKVDDLGENNSSKLPLQIID
jgi:protein involved in polysaccharide export with SLBB domain